jgi:hypothetical protein
VEGKTGGLIWKALIDLLQWTITVDYDGGGSERELELSIMQKEKNWLLRKALTAG